MNIPAGTVVRLWIPALQRCSEVEYVVVEHITGDSYKIECLTTGIRTFATAAAMRPTGCYSPELEHNRCQAGHPIHFDTTGRYEADTWVHCLIADVVGCPHDSEQILDVRPGYVGKHRVQS